MKNTGIIIIGGAIAAYFLLKGAKSSEGGTSGGAGDGLSLPLVGSSGGIPVSVAPVPNTDNFAISPQIQNDMFAAQFATKKTTAIAGKDYTVPQPNIWTTLGLNQVAVNPYALAESAKTGSTVNLGTSNGKNYVTGFGDIKMTGNTVAVNPYVLTAQPTAKKDVTPVFKNTMGGSSKNSGGTWTGNTFHRGRYR